VRCCFYYVENLHNFVVVYLPFCVNPCLDAEMTSNLGGYMIRSGMNMVIFEVYI